MRLPAFWTRLTVTTASGTNLLIFFFSSPLTSEIVWPSACALSAIGKLMPPSGRARTCFCSSSSPQTEISTTSPGSRV